VSATHLSHKQASSPEKMFKKDRDLIERSKTCLKNKEVRALRQSVLTAIATTTTALSTEECQNLLPEKGNVTVTKLISKTLVYSVDNIPYFFDALGRSDLYPTIFSLFRYPEMLRSIVIYEPVAEFLLNGADLMLPGVAYIPGTVLSLFSLAVSPLTVSLTPLPDLHSLRIGDKVSIRVAGNPLPFAIGKSETDGQMVEVLRQDNHPGWKKGRCASIVQIFGDQMWQQCRDRLRGAEIPGLSDPMTIVYPNHGFSRQTLAISSIESESSLAPKAETENPSVVTDVDTVELSELSITRDQDEAFGTEKNESEEQSQIEEEGEKEGPVTTAIPTETMDSLLMICLLRTFKYLIKDKDLPLLSSALWSIVTKSASHSVSFDLWP
jgi:predicted ribosome-associated RNA-binding protein Tma20